MIFKNVNELSAEEFSQLEGVYKQTADSPSLAIKKKYFTYYIENHSSLFFVAINERKVLGYICGMKASLEHPTLFQTYPYLKLFQDELISYPAHLHINVAPGNQGMGVGRKLMDKFVQALSQGNVLGVHIVTVVNAANNKFYQKSGFTFEKTHNFADKQLLFMGKSLNTDT
ncbi:MAG: hypothetical protein CME62_03840 [Halobacteriovoraceae bacterium]|nr:hypothetical protein [Halobacteriovoraceae bacterium]|tara:strand:+ start:20996 stop:21508 length:513 start_codon:yes stop_codon:yes gene_type:complete